MKRGLIFGLTFIVLIVLALSFVVAEQTCNETDDGQDYEEKGTTSIINSTNSTISENMTDYCSDDNTLVEYSCDGITIGSDEETCRYGCEDGACLIASCSSAHLNLCWDEPLCVGYGGFWYDYICHEEPQSGATTISGNNNTATDSNETENNQTESNETGSQGLGQTIRGRVKEGVYTSSTGRQIRVSELAQNRVRFGIGNIEAETELEIEQETENNQTRLRVKLRNGTLREIKIMPDTAAETALARLRLKHCNETNNCTIELKDIGERNISVLAYELQRQRHFKLYALFRKTAQVRVQVDAETGEIISIKKPWWAFLASEPEETD